MLSGDALSQWLQQQHITVVRGSLVRLGPSRLPQVSAGVDSHPIRVLLPVLRGGQAAVARAVVDGTQGPELALRVQAISSQTERARQTQRLVTMLTIAEQTRANPVRYPSVLAVLESFVMVVPGDQLPVGTTAAQHELWCDVMPWCPTSLARARDDVLAPGPSAAVARLAPLVRTVHAVHEHLSIVHRDITPNNVLVDPAGRLLLADWGIAHTVTAGQTSTSTELVGNRGFSLPPEMLAGHQAVGRYTDAWYLGCLLVWVFTGNAPGLQHGPDLLPPGLLGGPAGAALGTVVRSLCSPDPQRRMALLEAAQHLDRLRLAAPTDWVSVPATTVSAPVRDVPHATSPWNTFWLPVGLALGFLGVLGAGVGVWQATHRAPQAEHTVQTTAGSCWDDLAAGRCPDVDPVDLGGAFPVRPEVVPPYCGEEDIDAAPGDPTSTWLVHCSWSGETSDQASDVSMQWFRDAEAVAEHYRFHGMLADGVDVPVFDDGPDGPVYSATVDDQIAVAYCYAELPVCLEIQGDPQVVARTVTRFISLTSREAARLAQSYDR